MSQELSRQRLSFYEIQEHARTRTETEAGSLEHVLDEFWQVRHQVLEVSLERELKQDLSDQEDD